MLGRSSPCLLVILAAALPVYGQVAPADAGDVVISDSASNPISLSRVADDEADIRIDGHVDEAVWFDQPVLGDYRVIERANHIFSSTESQQVLTRIIKEWLARISAHRDEGSARSTPSDAAASRRERSE